MPPRQILVPALLVLGTTLMVAAMLTYPGDQTGDQTTRGFDPLRNYFCDLLAPRSHSGDDNMFGMLCARTGMVTTGLALLPLWWRFPLPLPPRRERLLRHCGVLSTLALPAVAWTPSGNWPRWHSFAILLAGLPGCATLALAAWAIHREREGARGLFRLTIQFAAVAASVAALWSLTFVASWPELALPIAQKVAWLLLLAWGFALSRR